MGSRSSSVPCGSVPIAFFGSERFRADTVDLFGAQRFWADLLYSFGDQHLCADPVISLSSSLTHRCRFGTSVADTGSLRLVPLVRSLARLKAMRSLGLRTVWLSRLQLLFRGLTKIFHWLIGRNTGLPLAQVSPTAAQVLSLWCLAPVPRFLFLYRLYPPLSICFLRVLWTRRPMMEVRARILLLSPRIDEVDSLSSNLEFLSVSSSVSSPSDPLAPSNPPPRHKMADNFPTMTSVVAFINASSYVSLLVAVARRALWVGSW